MQEPALHQRRGLGARQMDQILRVLRTRTRATLVALHVKTANRAACAFYDRLGFRYDEHVGVLERHYFLHDEYWDACRYTRPLYRDSLTTLFSAYTDGWCAVL